VHICLITLQARQVDTQHLQPSQHQLHILPAPDRDLASVDNLKDVLDSVEVDGCEYGVHQAWVGGVGGEERTEERGERD